MPLPTSDPSRPMDRALDDVMATVWPRDLDLPPVDRTEPLSDREEIIALDKEVAALKAQRDEAREVVANLEDRLAAVQAVERTERGRREAAEKRETETRLQFGDLKERLHEAELELARRSGYLARVREDDIVREELVLTGDPGGEQQMVPKRQSTLFAESRPPQHLGESDVYASMAPRYGQDRERRKPKHWITY